MNALSTIQIEAQFPVTPPARGMGKLAAVSFRQTLLNPFNVGFSLMMPIVMYLMFGASQPYSSLPVGNGNVAATVLVSMALFGVLLATASFGAAVSLERVQGISRAYALTPLSSSSQISARLLANTGVAGILVLITFIVGAGTGAQMAWWSWILSAVTIMVVSVLASAMGFAMGFLLRSDGAFAAVSGVLVLSAFGAGMTIPLDQMAAFFQNFAPWTPLWGAAQLVSLPVVGFGSFTWPMLISFLVWTGLFATLAVWGVKRDTRR